MLYPILISYQATSPVPFDGHIFGLFHMRLSFLTKLLFSALILWGYGLDCKGTTLGLGLVT